MRESKLRDELVRLSKSLFDRGFSVGSGGNISVVIDDGYLMTPTNSCLGCLDPEKISKLDKSGNHISGDKPSKEINLHRAFYDTRRDAGAVVHLHSTYATALSCLSDLDPEDCIPPLTPYIAVRVGRVKLLPYFRPGDRQIAEAVRGLDGRFAAVLLANHGPVVSGIDLFSAVYASEEVEESSKLLLILRGLPKNILTANQLDELKHISV